MKDLAFRTTPLHKCLLGMTLPITKDRFFQEIGTDSPKDFAKFTIKDISCYNNNSKWEHYENNVVKPFKEIKTFAEKAGVYVVEDFSLSHLQQMSNFDIVTIVGHWVSSCEKVEMADGLYSTTGFFNAIPPNTECMLDLIICNSAILLEKIKQKFHDIIVFGNKEPINFNIAISVYRCIIYEMQRDKSLNYLDATVLAKNKIYQLFKK